MRSDPIVFAYLEEPPFCFQADDGSPQGSDVELVTSVLKQMGIARVEMRLTEFAALLPGLVDGRWTITTPLFVSPERQRLVDFSRPVWALADGLLTRRADSKRLTAYEAVAADATARLVVVADQVQEQSGLKAGIPDDRIVRVRTQEDAVAMIRSGRAEAYASVAMAHRGFLARHPDPELAVVTAKGASPAYGAFAFAKSATDLRARFDLALSQMLGKQWHRTMMARYGFAPGDLCR
jgi:polar amino acid transport system substrate-binding protein